MDTRKSTRNKRQSVREREKKGDVLYRNVCHERGRCGIEGRVGEGKGEGRQRDAVMNAAYIHTDTHTESVR